MSIRYNNANAQTHKYAWMLLYSVSFLLTHLFTQRHALAFPILGVLTEAVCMQNVMESHTAQIIAMNYLAHVS